MTDTGLPTAGPNQRQDRTPDWIAAIDPVELEAELTRDPYPLYARLRRDDPMAWIPSMRMWMATSWNLVREIAFDAKSFHGASDPAHMRLFGDGNVLSAEGPGHAELRSFIDPNLRRHRVPVYIDDLVRPIARNYLAGLGSKDSVDIVTEYFEPLSVRSLGDYLGFTAVESSTLQRWFHGLGAALVNKGLDEDGNFLAPEAQAHADIIKAEIRDVVIPICERVARHPDNSGLSHWLHDRMPEGTVRTVEQILPTLYVILLGGMQEPGHGAGNTLYGLFTRPDQFARVKSDYTLLDAAIHEGLRWISPIGIFTRRVAKETEVGGVRLLEGEIVAGSLASANHDEIQFQNGAEFDLDRVGKPHIAFNVGAHACAGRYFGAAVERIALEELLSAYPNIAPHPEKHARLSGWFFRAVVNLPVQLEGRRGW